MANILLGEQNKELLWNILYSNKTFESIPQAKFNNVKTIFENAIVKVVNANIEMLESTTNINTIKTLVTQLNKVILQNIIVDITNFSQLLLTGTNVKENLSSFEKQYKEKQVSFNEYMTKIEPPQVNFEAIKDDILETNELDKLLENIQKERLKDIKEPIASNNNASNNIASNNNVTNKKQDKLEVVDLNVFEKEIFTENVVQDQSTIKKKKIVTIEELLNNVESIPEKKDTQSLLLIIDKKLTLLMENQQKILEKLGLTRIL